MKNRFTELAFAVEAVAVLSTLAYKSGVYLRRKLKQV